MGRNRAEWHAQGAAEYLLILAAVLVVVAVAVYYVTRPSFPPVSVLPAKYGDNEIRIDVEAGSIPAGDWQYRVGTSPGAGTWTDGTEELKSSYVSLGYYATDNYYVSLKHKPSDHIYFEDTKITIT